MTDDAAAPDAGAVAAQVDRITASPDFMAAPRMQALLRYLVEAELEGRGEAIKGYSIGVDVFDRDASFDPNTDSTVRIQVARLRRLLGFYYLTEGRGDAVAIDIPKGAYRVTFAPKEAVGVGQPAPSGPRGAEGPEIPRDTIPVAVLPFSDHSPDQSLQMATMGLCDELTSRLAGVASFALAPRATAMQFRPPVDIADAGQKLGASYIVDGTMRHAGGLLRVGVQVIDVESGKCDWAGRFERMADDPAEVVDAIAISIAGELRSRIYSAARTAIRQKPLAELSAWQLAIRAGWLPNDEITSLETQKRRLTQAQMALQKDANEARAHGVIADKLGYLANYDPPSDTAAAWVQAKFHARKALELSPANADVALAVGLFHWHSGNLDECMRLMRRLLALDPSHLIAGFAIDFLPFATTIAPPAVLSQFHGFYENLPADSSIRWVMQSWLCQLHLNNGDFDSVVEYGLRSSGVFGLPDIRLTLCAALEQVGSGDVAARLLEEGRADWPNMDPGHFGRVVIPRRFGSSPIMERVQGYYEKLAARSETGAAA